MPHRWISTLSLAITLMTIVPGPEPAPVRATPPLETALASLTGTWSGVLAYREDGTDERVEIPARLRAEAVLGGRGLEQRLAFADPDRIVESSQFVILGEDDASLSVLDPAGGERYRVESIAVTSPRDWRLELRGAGADDGRDVEVRLTLRREGNAFTQQRDVRAIDEPGADWTWRDALTLATGATDASALLGTWAVDVRPTPGADASEQPFVVTAVSGSAFEGSFHGTAIESARVNRQWGDLRFAFVTRDDSGAYHTSGVLRDDRLEGTTHAIGRDVLSVWTAERAR